MSGADAFAWAGIALGILGLLAAVWAVRQGADLGGQVGTLAELVESLETRDRVDRARRFYRLADEIGERLDTIARREGRVDKTVEVPPDLARKLALPVRTAIDLSGDLDVPAAYELIRLLNGAASGQQRVLVGEVIKVAGVVQFQNSRYL